MREAKSLAPSSQYEGGRAGIHILAIREHEDAGPISKGTNRLPLEHQGDYIRFTKGHLSPCDQQKDVMAFLSSRVGLSPDPISLEPESPKSLNVATQAVLWG